MATENSLSALGREIKEIYNKQLYFLSTHYDLKLCCYIANNLMGLLKYMGPAGQFSGSP